MTLQGRVGGIAIGAALLLVPPALAATPLGRFLARAGEETGFVPRGQPQIFPTARAWVAGEPPRQAKRDAARMRREGFVLGVYQPMTGTHSRSGTSTVLEFGSSRAAREEARVRIRLAIANEAGATITRYTIPGVPGALGFAVTAGGQGGSDAFFTEGRCMLLVADYMPHGNVAVAGPVKMAARTILRRNGGRCP